MKIEEQIATDMQDCFLPCDACPARGDPSGPCCDEDGYIEPSIDSQCFLQRLQARLVLAAKEQPE
jgi:hypothetical protein